MLSLPISQMSQLKAAHSITVRQFGAKAGGETSKGLRGETVPAQIHSVHFYTAHQHIRTGCVR